VILLLQDRKQKRLEKDFASSIENEYDVSSINTTNRSNVVLDLWQDGHGATQRRYWHSGHCSRSYSTQYCSLLDQQNPKERATAYLIVMAFFYLLRVGKHTLPLADVTTCTVQFRVCDIRFWQGQTLLPPATSDAGTLAAASSVTLTIDNQKNGQRRPSTRKQTPWISAQFAP
jgi:hypothetical protein